LLTPDALVWGVLGWGGVDVVRPVWRDLIECPQIRLRVDAIVDDGPVVAVRYTESGTSARLPRRRPDRSFVRGRRLPTAGRTPAVCAGDLRGRRRNRPLPIDRVPD